MQMEMKKVSVLPLHHKGTSVSGVTAFGVEMLSVEFLMFFEVLPLAFQLSSGPFVSGEYFKKM